MLLFSTCWDRLGGISLALERGPREVELGASENITLLQAKFQCDRAAADALQQVTRTPFMITSADLTLFSSIPSHCISEASLGSPKTQTVFWKIGVFHTGSQGLVY